MKRSEQDIRFQWDLTKIYPDTAAWEAAMQEAEAALAPLAAIPGTLGTSKEAFKKGLDTIYASMFKVELPYTYAFLKKTEDGSVAENQEMAARGESLIIKFNAAIAFLSPEILAIPAEKLDEWMQDEALATYRHTVDDIVRMRAHTLDAAREQMLALLGDAAGTPKAAFEMLTDVDLQLPMVKNEAGEEVRLTAGTFPVFRESRDRSVREGAFRAMFGTYRQFGDAIATLYGGSVKFDTYFSNQRGYASACEAALDGGNVPVSVYDSLIEAVHESLPSMRKYLELRRRALKLEKIGMFILLAMVVLIGSFSIVTTLVMLVMEKTHDIAILMSMGATKGMIRRIFMLQGTIIGVVGTLLGYVLGIGLALLLQRYQFIKLPPGVYTLDHLPILLNWVDIVVVGVSAMTLCFLATIYPARQASSLEPAEALRFE